MIESSVYMAHGYCLLWQPWLVAMHAGSDLLIFAAYCAIPVAIWSFLRRRKDLKLRALVVLFAMFILLCGLTHLIAAITLWLPIYEFQGWVKVATAVVSVATAAIIFPLVPKALAIPGPNQMQIINAELVRELTSHQETYKALKRSMDELEVRTLEGKAAEAAREELARIVDTAVDGVYSMDISGKITSWNRGAEKIYGWQADEIIGQPVTVLAPRGRYDEISDILCRIQAGETVEHYDAQRLHKNGGRIDVSLNISPLRDATGKVAGVSVIARDIAKQKQVERALAESEAKYHSLYDNAPAMMYSAGPDRRIVSVSNAWLQKFGYRRDEVIGADFLQFMMQETAQNSLESPPHEFLKAGITQDIPRQFLKKNGEAIDVVMAVSSERDEHGAVTLMHMGLVDITKRKLAEKALLESEEHFRALSATAQDPIIRLDKDGCISFWNDAASRAFGYAAEEALGMNVHSLLAPARYQDRANAAWPRFAETGQGPVVGKLTEVEARRKDGVEFPVELSIAALRVGDHWNAVGIGRDITERKQAEEALREAMNKLRETQQIAQVASWDWRIDSDTTLWSDEAWRLFNRDPKRPPPTFEEFIEYAHPDDRKRVRDSIAAAVASDSQFQLEFRLVRSDGEERALDVRGRVYRDADGKPVRTAGAIHDITEFKRIEDRLTAASLYVRSLIEAGLDMLMTITPEGKIADINEATAHAFGAPRESIIGTDFASRFTDPERARAAYRTAFLMGSVTNCPLTMRDPASNTIYLLFNASVYRSPKGVVEGVFAAARDITENKRREEELARLHELMTVTVAELRQHEHDAAVIDNLSETLQTCNSREEAYPLIAFAAKHLFPGSSGGLAVFVAGAYDLTTVGTWGAAPLMLPNFILDDCWALRGGQLHRLDSPTEGALCQHFETTPVGAYLCLPLATPGEALGLLHLNVDCGHVIDERVERLAGTLGDVVKLSLSNLKMRETLRYQAIRDPLTGLFNRRYLMETLPREIMRVQRSRRPLCVAMLDIDHFKIFNDSHGHDAGDLVLKEIGELLGKTIRGSDMACRYGGEEFLFVLPECDVSEAKTRMEQVRQEIKRKECLFHGHPLPGIAVSVGLAQFSDEMASEADLITAADQALYAAKASGRDRIVIYSHEMRQTAQAE
jgi:diguanylate cyclase (GGDEF)-like protein/PAS domain S-box-containing protein